MRIALQYLLPLLTPFILYLAWVFITQGKGEVAKSLRRGGVYYWAATAGIVLTMITLGAAAMLGGEAPGPYQAPRFEDGRIIPGGVRRE